MYRRAWITSLLFATCFAIVADTSDAARFRLFRRRRASYSEGLKRIAPLVDSASASYKRLNVRYSYDKANNPHVAFDDRIRVFLELRDSELLASCDSIIAEVKLTNVSDYRNPIVRYIPVTVEQDADDEYPSAYIDITNEGEDELLVHPSSVYRLFVNLHRPAQEYGEATAFGRVPRPYYVATSGPTRLDRARQQIVMRTFKEFYYRKQGWRSGERYSMDCYAYYMWATGFCTTGAQNGRTVLGRLFNSQSPYHNGSQIPALTNEEGPIHADYVRKPGHSFMLLAYDPEAKHVWTMEGNFNSTIEVVIRSVSSGWTVGHLEDQHIREGMFEAIPYDVPPMPMIMAEIPAVGADTR